MLKSMSFNGQRNSSIYLLRGRSKSPFHPLNREIVSTNGRHRLKKTERGLLEISQPIGFVAKEDQTQMDIIKSLTSWLITNNWGVLSFDDEPGRRYVALLQNDMNDFEKISWLREGTLQFVVKETLGADKTINIGTEFANYTITGQTETPWTSRTRFTVPQSSFTIETTKGGKIILNYDFIAGDILEIDYETRDVRLNGKDLAVSIALETVWFELEPGQVQIKASHPTEMKYTERYH
ncbi:phage tail family protein [Siminovitchia fortis]|uniref:Phage tail protein n=1 Tax=Siminovitchia fortis TaxID=254758 RepID=A0A443IN52_9BACI|nr:distal tail protein Dit [Siminovitchia fortis]RWR06756.1 hypothetical protein D4N35_013910 [Siminovitchia fortis]WHY83023.1 phage tail family protein [Siminovitchia fortis]